ncbi:16S rRNA (uracil(1498)-N(3))-methyltransferase [Reichenbachiella sp. MSK19-1]|uniref:RsmE family RNA methyltransferase n=1 Tax=Reichenbachiella sp. MSK19-1 TaxID=1897631 RepID=UPI000E6D14A1|nr:RsmE family RNA methyltransferase [Reichenbachiella sp. MSK19-1]RJE74285.1 16S rRNA (uracil(1498)-N(3))-methyltransferase [Reichenbachiella sp. MSK19-1]
MNYYYHPNPTSDAILSAEESAHAIKVLRKKVGDQIHIMDGVGGKYVAEITEANFRKCGFRIVEEEHLARSHAQVHIAIAPTKNIDRLEWFVEKACELGTAQISILLTKRTERKKINLERLEKKAISAMKQSKNFWKCQIGELTNYGNFINSSSLQTPQRFIAYVETGQEVALHKLIKPNIDTLIMIGPEGDFTPEEVQAAEAKGATAIHLGNSILRTETAGIIAAHTFNLANEL